VDRILLTKKASLPLFAKGITEAARQGNLLNFLRQFKHPTHNLIRGNRDFVNIGVHDLQKGPANLSRGIRTSLGNTADSLAILGEGVRGKGAVKGTTQALKNIGSLAKRQMGGDLYREVHNPVLVRKGGKTFAKSKWARGADREVIGKTNRGSHIVRRRKLYDPISLTTGGSGPSFGAISYALADKETPQSKRITDSAIDAALFSTSVPLGIAATLRYGKEPKKENKLKNKRRKLNEL